MTRFRGEYPDDWGEVALAVKEEAGWRCIRCDHPHAPGVGRTLTVHHLDGDKGNGRWWNLLALCQRCHLAFQGKVRVEQTYLFEHTPWFRPYVAGYYAFIALGEDLTREEVQRRQGEIIQRVQPWLSVHCTHPNPEEGT